MSHYFENDNNLESNIKKFSFSIGEIKFCFNTDNGVFSKGELDFGTNLLIKNALKIVLKGNILDLGCGYGPIGIVFKKMNNVNVDMIDINKRAIHLTKMNAKENNVSVNCYYSDGFENVIGKYDYIISNPPIRIGKKNLYKLLIDAKDYLINDGEMLIVVRKEQGALSLIKDMSVYYSVKTIDRQKGFFIISLKKN